MYLCWTVYLHRMKITRVLSEIIVLAFIILFVYAAVAKLIDHERFEAQVGQAKLLTPIAGLVSWVIPGLELLIVTLLVIPNLRLVGLYFSFGLMTLFTFYIAAILTLQENVPCSCGGVLEKMGWTEHLIFNVVFTGLAWVAMWFEQKRVTKTADA